MKKVLLLLAGICVIAGLATASGAKEGAAPAGAKTKLTMVSWFPRPTQAGDHDQIGEFLKANPDIELDYQVLEGSRYEELVRTKITAGDIPDVMVLMTPQVKDFGRLGILADVSKTPGGLMQAKVPSLNAALAANGKTVAVNGSAGVVQHTIFYNKVIFRKHGISEPKTRAEFEAACAKLKGAGEEVIIYGGADTWPYKYAQFPLGFTSQVKVALEKAGTTDLMEALYKGVKPSEIYGDTMRYFKMLVDKGYVSKTGLTMTWPESFTYFTDGKCAFLPQGPWIIGMVANQKDPVIDPNVFELGVMFFPEEQLNGKRYFQGYMEYSFALAAKAEKNPAAIRLFDFLTSETNLKAELSFYGRPTLFPIQLDIKDQVQKKMIGDLSGPGVEMVIFSFPEAKGWGETQMPSAFKAVHAGETAEKALAALDAFYADHKTDIKQ
jgi:ABC-type glycerol-3-phosphate transport system substrate-binding protein